MGILPTMAYVVTRPAGAWELRESRSTPSGPRARTLATFRTLTPETIEHARARATLPLLEADVRRAAHRVGAPVSQPTPDRAAAELLAELSAGRSPRQPLARLLRDVLEGLPDSAAAATISDSARAAAAWVNASPERRGESLRDLLLLTDRLPPSRAVRSKRFPRLRSTLP